MKVAQLCPILCDPITVHGILQARILKWIAVPFSRRSSQPKHRSQACRIAGGFFIIEPPGKPKNIGVGSLSLLQWIFLTQKSNRSLLHCRRILSQLSDQGSPLIAYLMQFITYICVWVHLYLSGPLKNLPAMHDTLVQFLGQEDPLEKG